MYRIYFATSNESKMRDVSEVASSYSNIEVYMRDIKVHERQSLDMNEIVYHKLLETFKIVQQPTIVDHTSLEIDALKGFPGVQAGLFWESIGPEICKITEKLGNSKATVAVSVAFTDGDKIFKETQTIKGRISAAPKGKDDFDWDSIFIPGRRKQTFAELSLTDKLKISPRGKALNRLLKEIRQIL